MGLASYHRLILPQKLLKSTIITLCEVSMTQTIPSQDGEWLAGLFGTKLILACSIVWVEFIAKLGNIKS